ncbi:hypothetical protein EU799_01090 [Corynebacterium silvaticum]|uniref:hypothetical protein n=1 Tax=Corynebacterium silvaticum TaxID=2320431 RepID=UPI0010687DC8|nr:hypothetical protein [Corynebacterium silvaticum]MBH5299381.1 hypothetical protein [Corynebacterium silvaticum]NOM64299.1 hypothetical protein [Corynebacterium silvaticum]TFA94132.1 hypothetical protein EU802_02040 [Corynebacterium silvaticum]TFA97032.1 hypothetical protein EU799_01090 [Corynebacterium silvaticum]TNX85727.1 hypothetical protein FIT55_02040 [Corynebacterium silvaticum]
MKLLSRKALISVATATAIAAGSLSTPAFAEDSTSTSGTNEVKDKGSSGSSDSNISAKDIKEWIGVVSAIIGIITTILTFAGRLDKFFK